MTDDKNVRFARKRLFRLTVGCVAWAVCTQAAAVLVACEFYRDSMNYGLEYGYIKVQENALALFFGFAFALAVLLILRALVVRSAYLPQRLQHGELSAAWTWIPVLGLVAALRLSWTKKRKET